MKTIKTLLCAGLLLFIYHKVPLGSEVTSGISVYFYKMSVSIGASIALFVLFGKNTVVNCLVLLEMASVALNIAMLFTLNAHLFHNSPFDILEIIHQNYKYIPFGLLVLQIAILVIGWGNGIMAGFKRDTVDRIRGHRGSDSNLRLAEFQGR